jgi:hypothetical protein
MMLRSIKNLLQLLLDKWIYWKYGRRIVIGNRDYKWCSIPVPDNCPRQSQTHPSIIYVSDKWQGATHWLATTPYPNCWVEFENPCIYYANRLDGINTPTVFTPVKNNPILPWPKGSKFNSDVELYMENNILYSIIREYDRQNLHKEIKVQASTDGQNWGMPHTLFSTSDADKELLSPSILKYKNKIRFYCLNGNAGIYRRGICTGINIWEGTSLSDTGFTQTATGNFLNKEAIGIEPWHCDVLEYEDKLYMVLCARDVKKKTFRAPMETYLAVSEDYQDFFIFPQPLIRHIKTYRPSAYMDGKRLYLYFSTIGRYRNDNSDRNIGVTFFEMDELLQELQTKNENPYPLNI